MAITNELRNSMTYDITTAPGGVNTANIGIGAFCDLCDAIDSVHANLEREYERLREQDRDGWIELTKDTGGEYIHEHDKVDWRDHAGTWHENATVVAVCNDGCYVMDGTVFHVHKSDIRHHRPDTWERIIEDAIRGDGGSYGCLEERFDAMVPALVARCKALAGDAE